MTEFWATLSYESGVIVPYSFIFMGFLLSYLLTRKIALIVISGIFVFILLGLIWTTLKSIFNIGSNAGYPPQLHGPGYDPRYGGTSGFDEDAWKEQKRRMGIY